MNIHATAGFLLAGALAAHAHADGGGRRFTFAGVIDQNNGPSPVQIGDRYAVQYLFEPNTPDAEPAPGFGSYPGAISEVRGGVGPWAVNLAAGDISVRDNAALGDVYEVSCTHAEGGLGFFLADYGSSAFGDDHLPVDLAIAEFELRGLAMHVHDPVHWGATGPITGFCSGPACVADCTADGALTVADFGCFQTRFVQGSVCADCNLDTLLTVADFGCFQTLFAVGCP